MPHALQESTCRHPQRQGRGNHEEGRYIAGCVHSPKLGFPSWLAGSQNRSCRPIFCTDAAAHPGRRPGWRITTHTNRQRHDDFAFHCTAARTKSCQCGALATQRAKRSRARGAEARARGCRGCNLNRGNAAGRAVTTLLGMVATVVGHLPVTSNVPFRGFSAFTTKAGAELSKPLTTASSCNMIRVCSTRADS